METITNLVFISQCNEKYTMLEKIIQTTQSIVIDNLINIQSLLSDYTKTVL